jgi:hypothetical protein
MSNNRHVVGAIVHAKAIHVTNGCDGGRSTPKTQMWILERLEIDVPQPKVAEIYYTCCVMINRWNRCRQEDDILLEMILNTMGWSMRVNINILGMIIVDS